MGAVVRWRAEVGRAVSEVYPVVLAVPGCPLGAALSDLAVAPSAPLRFPVDCTLRISSGAIALRCVRRF
jgi:hypothetical protein